MESSFNKQPVMSVVIPVYKTPEEYLRCCIESLQNQTLKNIQIILVDDGSPDNCGNICEEYKSRDKRIEVLHKSNGGVSSARNLGLQHVRGRFLTFVDSDDILFSEAWEKTVAVLEDTQADCAVFGWYANDEKPHKSKKVSQTLQMISAQEAMCQIAGDNDACGGGYPWNKVWRTAAVCKKNNGRIPLFDTKLVAYEDKYWVLLTLNGLEKVCLIPEIYYDYRYVENSLTNSCNDLHNRQFNAYLAYDKICDFLYPIDKKAYRAGLGKYFRFCFIDVKNQYSWRSANSAWLEESKKALMKVCRRIRPGDLIGFKYNLAWLVCLVILKD